MIRIWVIYEKPTDFPDAAFVMREHHIKNPRRQGRTVTPTNNVRTAGSIEELRGGLPPGLRRMPRADEDEAQIVEWWF